MDTTQKQIELNDLTYLLSIIPETPGSEQIRGHKRVLLTNFDEPEIFIGSLVYMSTTTRDDITWRLGTLTNAAPTRCSIQWLDGSKTAEIKTQRVSVILPQGAA